MKNQILKYFLATNSCNGFVSSFGECYDASLGWHAYIIKGGPGTGKSSFMRFIAKKCEEKGLQILYCPCSSDPKSLDAVILPEKRTVLLDGTAPHTLDPVYPAVCEEILNFGQFWNTEILKGKEAEIISVTKENKALHRSAARYLSAAGQLLEDNYKIVSGLTDTKKVEHFADRLCKKYIPHTSGKPKEWIRYISGVTPNGITSLTEAPLNEAENAIIIEDNYGFAADIIMNRLAETALKCGHEIVRLRNSFLPHYTDHIVIPSLSLCFLREYEYCKFSSNARRIHAKRFFTVEAPASQRGRLRFNQKATRELLQTSCNILAKAKEVHDRLEAYYIDAMDFEALGVFAEHFAEKLLQNG